MMNRKMISLLALIFLLVAFLGLTANKHPAEALALTPTPTPGAAGPSDEFRWNLGDIYPDVDTWDQDFKTIKDTYIPKYKNYEGKLGNAASFLELMTMDVEASRMNDKVYVYAHMKMDENQTDSKVTEMSTLSESLYSDLVAAGSYIRPELVALPEATLQSYLKDENLKDFHMMLQFILDQKAHTLSKEEEVILARAGEMANTAENIASKIREADLQFPTIKDPGGKDVELSEANLYEILQDPHRSYRQSAYNAVLTTYGTMKNSLAAALDAQMRKDSFFAASYKYDTTLDAALSANHIPGEVYTALVIATDKNLSSLHKYVSLRKDILKVDKVRIYDLYVPLVSGYTPAEYKYEDAKTLLKTALAPLGSAYLADMDKAFSNRWIDVYPGENKTSGGYSWGAYDTHPYILLNYNDSLDSLLTLAHEMGHSLNSYYTNGTQPYYNSTTPIFTAEVASTTNELIVLRYLVANAKDDKEKLYYLDRLAETIRGTFFAQVMYAEFELKIHQRVEDGDALSVYTLNGMWGEILTSFYGPDFELTEEAKLGWSRIPHFYYNYYVYQYSTGIAAADYFSTRLIAGENDASAKYQVFLNSGSSDYPVVVLKTAGVDMLSSQPVDILLSDFDKTVAEMEALMIKMGTLQK